MNHKLNILKKKKKKTILFLMEQRKNTIINQLVPHRLKTSADDWKRTNLFGAINVVKYVLKFGSSILSALVVLTLQVIRYLE